jgi:hypothetical protein
MKEYLQNGAISTASIPVEPTQPEASSVARQALRRPEKTDAGRKRLKRPSIAVETDVKSGQGRI